MGQLALIVLSKSAKIIMKPKVIFIHIPKTAGTSFYENCYYQYSLFSFFRYLDYQHGDLTQVSDDFRIQDYKALPELLRRRILLHAGHMPFGFHTASHDDFRYATFLRDPVSRIVSNYHHMKLHAHPMNKVINEEGISLKDFIADSRFQDGQNFMTRILSGTFGQIDVDERCYLAALSNIEKHQVLVGIQEYFEESLALFAMELGWKKPLIFTHANKGGLEREGVDLQLTEWIRDKNQWDVRLYEVMKKSFERKLQANINSVRDLQNQAITKPPFPGNWFKRKLNSLLNHGLASKRRT